MSYGRILDRYSPSLTGDGMDWMQDAACTQVDPEIFFPEQGGSSKQAKKICAGCDVVEQCLVYGVKTDRGKKNYGIFGGKSEQERRKIRKALKLEEKDDDEYPESYGGREDQYDWEMEPLLSEEEKEYGSDL